MCVCACVCVCACMHVCVHVCMRACMRACMHGVCVCKSRFLLYLIPFVNLLCGGLSGIGGAWSERG